MAYGCEVRTDSLRGEWSRFVHNGTLPTQVPAPVLRSWLRCRQLGVDPEGGKGSRVLSMADLGRCLKRDAVLVSLVRDLLRDTRWAAPDSGFLFFLTDRDANLLHLAGDRRVLRDFEVLINFGLGVNWGEGCVGTTAVSLALDERRPVPWMSEEKYCVLLKERACTAVPIKSRDGSVVGVLGAGTDLEGLGRGAPPVFEFLRVAAAALNGYYQCFEMEQSLDRARKSMAFLLDEIPEGVLITDQDGTVVEVNRRFGAMLGLDLSGAVGKAADALLPPLSRDRQGGAPRGLRAVRRQKSLPLVERLVRRKLEFQGAHGAQEFCIHILQKVDPANPEGSDFRARIRFEDIQGASPQIQQARDLARDFAAEPYDVLIEGRTGTGKELFAQAIHNASCRAAGPFVPVNCGAIPAELFESELCGYEGGAFTGARPQGCPGKLGLAQGGTLFLDEIGELPLDLQVKLLRILQEKRYVRLGGQRPLEADVRVIAATNQDVEELLRAGRFREDLFWRLNVLSLRLPSLAERTGDVAFLARHLLAEHSAERGVAYALDPEALRLLQAYPWPGNVRELQNCLKGAVVQARDGRIGPRHLPERIRRDPAGAGGTSLQLRDAERGLIAQAIASTGGNLTQAARLVGISRVTLYSKIKKYSLLP